jgi:hypothetical protein
VTQKSVGEREVLVILMPQKKGSGTLPSAKELLERRSSAFHHKNIPGYESSVF